MAVAFSGIAKQITVTTSTEIDVRQNIYSAWKHWVIQDDNTKFKQAIRPVGGDAIGGGQGSPNYFFLMNDWKIVVDGVTCTFRYNLYCEEATNSNYVPFVYTNGGHSNNEISSSPTTSSEGGGGGLTTEEHDQLMAIPEDTTALVHATDIDANIVSVTGTAVTDVGDFKADNVDLSSVTGPLSILDSKVDIIDANVDIIDGKVDIIDNNVDSSLVAMTTLDGKIDLIDSNVDSSLTAIAAVPESVWTKYLNDGGIRFTASEQNWIRIAKEMVYNKVVVSTDERIVNVYDDDKTTIKHTIDVSADAHERNPR